MTDGSVSKRELTEVVTNHVGLDKDKDKDKKEERGGVRREERNGRKDARLNKKDYSPMLITYLNFNLVVTETVVDTEFSSDHLREDDSIAEVGLDDLGLVKRISDASTGLLDAVTEVLESLVVTELGATSETTASTSVEHLNELILRDKEELLGLNTAVEVLPERLLSFVSLEMSRMK